MSLNVNSRIMKESLFIKRFQVFLEWCSKVQFWAASTEYKLYIKAQIQAIYRLKTALLG